MNIDTGEVRNLESLADLIDVKKSRTWVDLEAIFKKGRIFELDGTRWEIRRADIRPGTPGRVVLKLRGMRAVVTREEKS